MKCVISCSWRRRPPQTPYLPYTYREAASFYQSKHQPSRVFGKNRSSQIILSCSLQGAELANPELFIICVIFSSLSVSIAQAGVQASVSRLSKVEANKRT